MKFERSSGILLHPTSFAGPFGIGDIGPQGKKWIDFLFESGCSLWQVLPLGPTGYGDSPYQCFSAFAGNPYLISPDALLEEELIVPEDLVGSENFPESEVDFGAVIPWKLRLLDIAFERFKDGNDQALRNELNQFRRSQAFWLEDYALFMAIKNAQGGGSWADWPLPIRTRQPVALQEARLDLQQAVQRHEFFQFLFFRQWAELKSYAANRAIRIIGDAPIFVAHDSSDVWSHPELFYLDKECNPTVVAGVPPDYFSETGQLWGNPLYRWDKHASSGYEWWIKRLQSLLQIVDIIRLDHFRGFAGYWEVPAGEPTAVNGRWVQGPGLDFFGKVLGTLGDLPIIAEDLGEITPDVIEIRDRFNLPGMRIIQFAFHGYPAEPFLPHNHVRNSIIYTGTHDNDTSRGWYDRVDEREKDFARRYLGQDGTDIAWDFIRAAWASVAVFALAPLQDFLELGNEARMNYPGNPSGNWTWRMPPGALKGDLRERIEEFNFLYARMNPLRPGGNIDMVGQEQSLASQHPVDGGGQFG
jgi:4-alpha-glucanotransferase